jgi:hypothetical protein
MRKQSLLVLLGSFAGHAAVHASEAAAFDAPGYLRFHAADQLVYDDNLFRIPKDFGALDTAFGSNANRTDYINRASVGTDDLWTLAAQSLALRLEFVNNRYHDNSFLDYNSLYGSARWNWSFAARWTGEVGADYTRALAGFTNNRIFARDVLQTQGYSASFRYRLNSGWTLLLNGREAKTTHGIDAQRINDSNNHGGSIGIEYGTGLGDAFGADYRYAATTYPQQVVAAGGTFDQGYHESTADGYFRYALTGKTKIEAGAGYLDHRYPNGNFLGYSPNYSGAIWHASLQYQPTEKVVVEASARRALRAYLEVDSDYFVSEIYSIAPTWSPTDHLQFSMQYSYERQNYLGTNQDSLQLPGVEARRDRINSVAVTGTYSFLQHLQLDLSYRREQRNSNREGFSYLDAITSLSLRGNL